MNYKIGISHLFVVYEISLEGGKKEKPITGVSHKVTLATWNISRKMTMLNRTTESRVCVIVSFYTSSILLFSFYIKYFILIGKENAFWQRHADNEHLVLREKLSLHLGSASGLDSRPSCSKASENKIILCILFLSKNHCYWFTMLK